MAVGPESPREVLTRMIFGCRATQALYVAAKLGVADLLAGGSRDCDVLAEELGVQPRPLFRVMRALAAQGIFAQDQADRFGLTPCSELLRSDVPDSARYIVINTGEEYYRAAGELLHTVRTGQTAFDHIYGKGHFDYLAENEEASRTFNLFMAQSIGAAQDPLGKYDFAGRELAVDVGGGRGTLVAQVLRANPRLRGVLFDLSQGVAEAREYLEAQGVGDRCRIVAGSFFESIPAGGDVYLLSRILHDWPDGKAAAILAGCRRAIREGGTLVIRDAVIQDGSAPSAAKQLDLTMLFMTGGMERTEREWRDLLRGARFDLSKVVRTGQTFDIIEATPV